MTVFTPGSQTARRPIGPAVFDGFVRAQGTALVDGRGRPLLIRGVGLGNWMLPEGYMWGFGVGAESPREIEAYLERLIGPAAAESFWRRFRSQYISERDIQRIAECGFDHVRLPINARMVQDEQGAPIEEGYRLIDELIEWCRAHGLWVVLDLHGAPGGQTGTNIDDSPRGLPELFMDENYRRLTVELWRELARRYREETAVLGYDLLNEPIPNEWQHTYADALVLLYRDLTTAIREIDDRHLIIYEGSHWATNWSIFTEVWDSNSMLQFHKYWSSPDTASIQKFLDVREALALPIYMGEGGENTLEWLYTAFRLYEAHGIGWNLWPWKKIDTRTSPASIRPPEGWERIVAGAAGAQVDAADALRILDDLLDGLAIERCQWRADVVAAVFADEPRRIPAWGFGFRGQGVSHSVVHGRPHPVTREADGVTIDFRPGVVGVENPFAQTDGRPYASDEVLTVELDAGDWLEYEATVVDPLSVRVTLDGRLVDGAVVEASPRGIRLTAREHMRFDTITIGEQFDD